MKAFIKLVFGWIPEMFGLSLGADELLLAVAALIITVVFVVRSTMQFRVSRRVKRNLANYGCGHTAFQWNKVKRELLKTIRATCAARSAEVFSAIELVTPEHAAEIDEYNQKLRSEGKKLRFIRLQVVKFSPIAFVPGPDASDRCGSTLVVNLRGQVIAERVSAKWFSISGGFKAERWNPTVWTFRYDGTRWLVAGVEDDDAAFKYLRSKSERASWQPPASVANASG